MTLNKKILATAIVGGLFAAAAQAQVNISATTPVPVTFASELVVPTGGLVLTNSGNALDLVTALRYSFSPGEVRHARIECSPNIRFVAGSAVTFTSATATPDPVQTASIGAVNGIGTNAIHFSITAGTTAPTAPALLTVTGNRNVTNTVGGSCTYSLYDQPSQAANGGEAGRITTVTGAYLAFNTSYTLTATPTGAVANVEATPAFSRFVSAPPTNSVDRASLGNVEFVLRSPGTPRLASGAPATLADLLAAGSNHVVTGDFTAAANADGTFTGAALARVFFGSADCSVSAVSASALTATSARFDTGAAAVTATLCYAPRSGVAIPVSTYSQVFNAVSANPTLFAPTGRGPVALGEITRNGTQLQAPLAQIPTGWLSRVVLTNTGPLARPFTITAQTEAGVTATMGAAATGSVPANGSLVLNVADIATFAGTAPRGTLNVTVAGPNAQIQGLYQIVNPASGSISNHVMVRPGTN